MILTPTFAFDRASHWLDADGRLHVATANLSKATVSPYLGREIPGAAGLGLAPDRRYMMLRDPGELEKATASFNGLPVLTKHFEVTAGNPRKDLVVGATGTEAEFANPYLRKSLVIWDQNAIDEIESGQAAEISCGYRYRPVMTLGSFGGQAYDGVMLNIVGSHVALVPVGRVGPECALDGLPMPDWLAAEARWLVEFRRCYVR